MPDLAEMTTKQAVLEVLKGAEKPLGPREVEAATDKNYNTIRTVLRGLFNQGDVAALKDNTYCLPGQFPDVIEQIGVQDDGASDDARELVSASPSTGKTQAMLSYPFLSGGPAAGEGHAQHDEGRRITVPREVAAQWGQGRVVDSDEGYWTRVQGNSMEPWLPDQTPIFVEKADEFRDGGRYVIWLGNVEADIVKRVERVSDKSILLISDNGGVPNLRLTHVEGDIYEDVQIEEKVTLTIRGRVLFPPDTGHGITEAITKKIGTVLREQAAGYSMSEKSD